MTIKKMNKIPHWLILLQLCWTTPIGAFGGGGIANAYFLEKQKFLLEILHHVQQPLLDNELQKTAEKGLVIDKEQYVDFNKYMKDFIDKLQQNHLLAASAEFLLSHDNHLSELKGLYYFLYNAKDWETLKQNICWARLFIHPQMFVFAMTEAITRREDFSGLILPKIYEIWPQQFYDAKYIRKLEAFNHDQWNWKNFLYQKRQTTYRNVPKQGEVYKITPKLLKHQHVQGNLRNASKWTKALQEVSLYAMATDNQISIDILQDKDLHSYWYYINMGLWLHKDMANNNSNELRDWWFWNLRQLITRYKISAITKHTQYPSVHEIINFKGEYYKTSQRAEISKIRQWLQDLHATTLMVLNEQHFVYSNRTKIHLNSRDNLELFLSQYFDIEQILKNFMMTSTERKPQFNRYFETMLRDEHFFNNADTLVKLYKTLRSTFDPYHSKDYANEGISINSVNMTLLQTFYTTVASDVSNLLRPSHLYYNDRLMWCKSLLLRQQQLQHKSFTMTFNISSAQDRSVIVRTFLQLDCHKEHGKCSPDHGYLHLDTFISDLATGPNIIERHSNEFYGYTNPPLTYTELYQFTKLALKEQFDFPLNMTTGNCRFPQHLMLPRGLEGQGLSVRFWFVATPYNSRSHRANNLNCDFSESILTFDDLPAGFPFDRDVEDRFFVQDNVFVKRMKIYHDNV